MTETHAEKYAAAILAFEAAQSRIEELEAAIEAMLTAFGGPDARFAIDEARRVARKVEVRA